MTDRIIGFSVLGVYLAMLIAAACSSCGDFCAVLLMGFMALPCNAGNVRGRR